MALVDFLNECRICKKNEEADWGNMRRIICKKYSTIALMPAITCDLWPVHVLNDHLAGTQLLKSIPDIYIVPLGGHMFWIKPEVEDILNRFYRDEEIENNQNYYGASLEEVILFNHYSCNQIFIVDGVGVSCVIAKIELQKGDIVYCIGIMDTAEHVWENIIEHYDVPVEFLIDSHKGLGNWLVDIPLYKKMCCSSKRDLLPEYYFKGKYISADAPEGFEFITDIEESAPYECISKIYKANWKFLESPKG